MGTTPPPARGPRPASAPSASRCAPPPRRKAPRRMPPWPPPSPIPTHPPPPSPTAATPQGPALDATVARVIYHGDHLRLLCAIAPGQALATVKLPLTGAGAHPQAGDAVQLQFPPEAMRIYACAASQP